MNKNISVAAYACIVFASAYFGGLARGTSATTAPAAEVELKSGEHRDFIISDLNGVTVNFSQRKQPADLTKTLIILGLIAVTGSLAWHLSRSRSGAVPGSFKPQEASAKTLLERVSPKLRRQLLRLVNDPKTANRLLMGIHQRNRDRSPNWLAEKAIYDLRRGR